MTSISTLSRQRALTRSQGFSMVEVLVSLVVFSLGMLGAAGLQLATIRSNQFTAQSSIATQLVRDYEEIVQLVRSADIATSEGTTALNGIDTNSVSSGTIVNCKSTGAACSPADLAGFMVNEWKQRVKTELPGGRVVVCVDSAPKETSGANQGLYRWACDGQGDMIMIKVGWAAKADKGDFLMQTNQTDSRPRIAMTVFGNQKDFTD